VNAPSCLWDAKVDRGPAGDVHYNDWGACQTARQVLSLYGWVGRLYQRLWKENIGTCAKVTTPNIKFTYIYNIYTDCVRAVRV